MPTLKTRLDDLTAAVAAKTNRLNDIKQNKADIRQDLSSNSTTFYPSVAAVKTVTDDKVDKVAGKELSDENYTLTEKQKLAGLESSKFRGQFTTVGGIPLTGNVAGSYADVDAAAAGEPTKRYIWDVNDAEWIEQVGASTEMTASEIKALYESNADTNAFTDAEKAQIVTNDNDIATNAGAISTNAGNISTNTTNITTAQNTANSGVSKADAAQADADALESELITRYKALGIDFPDYAANFNTATVGLPLA